MLNNEAPLSELWAAAAVAASNSRDWELTSRFAHWAQDAYADEHDAGCVDPDCSCHDRDDFDRAFDEARDEGWGPRFMR